MSYEVVGTGDWASVYAVTELAVSSVGAAGVATAELVGATGSSSPEVTVDRRLASWWFAGSLQPDGWSLPPIWDAVAGDYEGADGWIRLHTNAAHHRAAALEVLGVAADRAAVAGAVDGWRVEELESAIVANAGVAAAMRSTTDWSAHPQGRAVEDEPLVRFEATDAGPARRPAGADRPLAGVRVLDLTRVLAGPVATRLLAGLGADVLRLDPPEWEEPAVVPEVTLGKRCARLDLRDITHRQRFEALLAGADILVTGYRSDALDRLGFDATRRSELSPGLVDVALDAYGWTGPWAGRRGFDSLVQMSCGIAAAGMVAAGADRPVPLPVQALDHATGYLLAAGAIDGWRRRLTLGHGSIHRLSLARTARLLVDGPAGDLSAELPPITAADFQSSVEATAWGPARRLRSPVRIGGRPLRWERPAVALGSSPLPGDWPDRPDGDAF